MRLYRYAAGVLICPERESDAHFFRISYFHGERVGRHPIHPGVYLEGCDLVVAPPCAYLDPDVAVLRGPSVRVRQYQERRQGPRQPKRHPPGKLLDRWDADHHVPRGDN